MKSDIIDQLFSQYYNEALLYTISLCRNRTIAEDVVSNAFFKALTLADDSIRDFKPWLLTVCRNEFISVCRKNSRFTGEEIPEDLADDREEVIEGIIRREEYRSLYRAIGLLPDAQKEVVTLFYFSGLPVKSISEITGKSETNIKVLLCRARDKLRTILEEEQ
ncbi:MAG: sigma-70 family RNA polymerase sigma factor [Oscillospiraceae bacterium]|jgi:RNA polymerase sigma-70 factor (ECF subfamily)|nr:sigma-70 family RNA polymerase sigma factor [Oscillospiraceae bacterium]MBQ3803827.1 sigma-70 family RNA polymerase sigma factor [Oscillospiraceae bacterium]MBQ6428899.1 sigma-70 family RNA polymerase sigma factor [Oscillospiraceae bacterium]MBR2800266.1 sigma-70 family RNA polymerase sigma factor [Oscillospiraceae bacterium]MBR3175032.1 sigma-70 family RNA polymerase sigma factor [Oscillospiraceae bacterium]